MGAIENPAKHQCALFKSSRKHYIDALEKVQDQKPIHGHLTAARETAEAGDDMELAGWLQALLSQYESSGELDSTIGSNIVERYNEYNTICDWGFEPLDPNDPFKLPGDGGVIDL